MMITILLFAVLGALVYFLAWLLVGRTYAWPCAIAAVLACVAITALLQFCFSLYHLEVMTVSHARQIEDKFEITLNDGEREYKVTTKNLFAESEQVIVWQLEVFGEKEIAYIQRGGRNIFDNDYVVKRAVTNERI